MPDTRDFSGPARLGFDQEIADTGPARTVRPRSDAYWQCDRRNQRPGHKLGAGILERRAVSATGFASGDGGSLAAGNGDPESGTECAPHRLAPEEAELFRIRAGRYIRIKFSDDGCGMSQTLSEKIFEPFFTSKVAGSGPGLGLSMVYGFVRQSNGAICVDSVPGKGTCFTILLPDVSGYSELSDLPAQVTAAPQVPEAPSGELVLLVEDDLDVRRTLRRKIAALGFPVVEAGDADEALILLRQLQGVGVVLSDVDMPGSMNGFGLASQVQKQFPQLQMVLMSGQNIQSPTQPELAAIPFLRKPFSDADLLQHLRAKEIQN
ncbi:ATP-binding protein [Thalassovita sp.]|uniref:ATP-binding protein n=1 Tax=Thalassovita sp. TaxID=1979401 RepID=UPI0029DE8A23|nr:ATP-binding protein [Thalassovita sp.]